MPQRKDGLAENEEMQNSTSKEYGELIALERRNNKNA